MKGNVLLKSYFNYFKGFLGNFVIFRFQKYFGYCDGFDGFLDVLRVNFDQFNIFWDIFVIFEVFILLGQKYALKSRGDKTYTNPPTYYPPKLTYLINDANEY